MATISIGNASITVAGQSLGITTLVGIGAASLSITGGGLFVMPIVADPIEFTLSGFANAYVSSMVTNRENDVYFYAGSSRIDGIPEYTLELNGDLQSRLISVDPIEYTLEINGTVNPGYQVVSDPIEYTLELKANWYSIGAQRNWVEWSKIGDASFVKDRTNEAGDRPMSWNGWAWRALKLGKYVIIYGDNGICVMDPVISPVVSWGFTDIGNVGIVSPWSVAGTETIHYFITSNNELWRFTPEKPERLGFKEFLEPLTNPVLLYDSKEDRLFISDGTSGYVFDGGLGGGYATITGITSDYVVSPDAMPGVPISIMTDTIDLGHRGIKTVTFVEVGTNTTEALYVALDYRYTKDEAWRTSPWTIANPEGVARITIAAVEFRVRIKQLAYDELRIDYINVRHQRNDLRFLRGPIFEQPDQGEF